MATAPSSGGGAPITLQHRMLAAAGASVLSAVVVNPLDVVKVRMQAQAANAASAIRSSHAYCFSIPVRSIQSSSRKFLVGSAASNALAHHPVLQEMIASCLGRSAASSSAAVGAHECLCAAAAGVGALPLPGDAHPPHPPPTASSRLWPATTTTSTASSSAIPSRGGGGGGMVETLRGIVRQEGTLSLWRGLDSALLMSVPTVLLYYPLYDHFMHRLTEPAPPPVPSASQQQQQRGAAPALGAAAPMLAGAASRAITVVSVAPLEYVRTLQQAGVASRAAVASAAAGGGGAGGVARGESTWQTLRSSVGAGLRSEGGAAAGSGARTQQAAAWATLRALPRLWTGLSATIARDVPFSAVYWGLVEPIRGRILSSSSSLAHLAGGGAGAASAPRSSAPPSEAAADDLPGRALSALPTHPPHPAEVALDCLAQGQDDWAAGVRSSSAPAGPALSSPHSAAARLPAAPGAAGASAAQATQPPSHSQVVLANVLAGSLAGGAAAALTTPFDVVKTRMQLSSAQHHHHHQQQQQAATSMLGVLRQVVRQQGVAGLFVGVGPRAARCAPACAIVLFSYELLKRVLAEQQQVQQL